MSGQAGRQQPVSPALWSCPALADARVCWPWAAALRGCEFAGAGEQPAFLELPGTLLPVPPPVHLSHHP